MIWEWEWRGQRWKCTIFQMDGLGWIAHHCFRYWRNQAMCVCIRRRSVWVGTRKNAFSVLLHVLLLHQRRIYDLHLHLANLQMWGIDWNSPAKRSNFSSTMPRSRFLLPNGVRYSSHSHDCRYLWVFVNLTSMKMIIAVVFMGGSFWYKKNPPKDNVFGEVSRLMIVSTGLKDTLFTAISREP